MRPLKIRKHMCGVRSVAAMFCPHERVDAGIWVAHQDDAEHIQAVPYKEAMLADLASYQKVQSLECLEVLR